MSTLKIIRVLFLAEYQINSRIQYWYKESLKLFVFCIPYDLKLDISTFINLCKQEQTRGIYSYRTIQLKSTEVYPVEKNCFWKNESVLEETSLIGLN